MTTSPTGRKIIIRYNATGERWCDRCKCYMGVEQFHHNRASTAGDGLQRYCRLCARDARRTTYERRREAEIVYARQWQAAHPEQARINTRRAQRVSYRLRKLAREAQRLAREEVAG